MLSTVALLAIALFVATRPAVLASFVLPAASRAIGGEVTAARVALDGTSEIVIEDLLVRAPGWDGEGGEVARADRIRIRFSPWQLLVGDLSVRSVDVGRLELRLAERADSPSEFSILALAPEPSDEPAQRPANIAIEELVLSTGVVTRDGYRPAGDLRFKGALLPVAGDPYSFTFELSGRPDSKGRVVLARVDGAFDGGSRTVEVNLEDFEVDADARRLTPIAVREWLERLALVGRIREARVSVSPDREPSADFDIEGVAINLPVEALGGGALKDAWSGFANGRSIDLEATPRMTIREGRLRLSGDRFALEGLKGELGAQETGANVMPLPFECAFSLDIPRDALPPFDWEKRDAWFTQAIAVAPFTIDIGVRRFSSPEEGAAGPNALLLPREAAKVLGDFNITQWTIDVETRFQRGSPLTDGSAAPIRSSGSLRLERGSGAFEEFPYRLDDVSAVISFENDDLTVERLTGRGAEGAVVRIDGKLDGIATGAEIDLNVRCDDAPIDRRLFDAFEAGPRSALELLFDERSARLLAESGLLPDRPTLDAQQARLAELGDSEASKAARARLKRSIDAGPFALGGRCGFDMRVYSPAGFGQPVIVTGDVRVRNAGLVFGRFPYPLRIQSGSFKILDEAILIGPGGLQAVTPAGGNFVVTGSLSIPRDGRGGRDLFPLIGIADTDDAVNPALLAAIPFAGDEVPADWPGATLAPAGELLRALGLSGRIELRGLVTSKDDGREDFDFQLEFADGVAAPGEAGRAWLASQGMPWPGSFSLEDCSASVDITPETVRIERCVGSRGDGSLSARASASLDGPDRLIEIELRGIPIDRTFEGYLDDDPARAAEIFTALAPTGAMDGTIRREVDARGERTVASFEPRSVEVTLDGRRVRAERASGRIALDAGELRADGLEFRLAHGASDDGTLRISGPLEAERATRAAPFDATLVGGRFESPVFRALLGARAPKVLASLDEFRSRGTFDARFVRGDGERFELQPRTLSVGPDGARLAAEFSDGSHLDTDGERVAFVLDGGFTEGAEGSVAIAGELDLGARESSPESVLEASLSIEAKTLTSALREQLPPPFAKSAKAIDLRSDGAFTLELPEITGRWAPGAPAESPSLYALRGEATFAGASFDAGTRISALDGTLPLRLRFAPGVAEPVEFEATLSSTKATVFERALGRATTTLRSARRGDALEIRSAGDIARGRFDLATDIDFANPAYTARIRVADADYETISAPATPPSADAKGRISGFIDLAGPMAAEGRTTEQAAQQRTGRGRVAVRDGSLAATPVAMRILQLSQLMLPLAGSLSSSDANFLVRGNTIDVVDCELASGTLRLAGRGTVDIPTFGVAVRLFPRGTVPIVSDVIGGVTNQIFAIDVTGTLADPKVKVTPLPAVVANPNPAAPADTPAPVANPQGTPPAPAIPETQRRN